MNLDVDEDLSSYGFDSITLTQLSKQLNETYELQTTPALLFEYPTIASFADYLQETYPQQLGQLLPSEPLLTQDDNKKQRKTNAVLRPRFINQQHKRTTEPLSSQNAGHHDIAIIGMAGFFPGAPTLTEFWEHLVASDDLISAVPEDRPELRTNPDIISSGGFIEGVDQFDAAFFNISPREAELMDPQQRLFLQTVWHAVEEAGYQPAQLHDKKNRFVRRSCDTRLQ